MPASKSVRRYGQDPAASDRPCGSGDCYRTSGRTHGRTGRPKGLTSGGPRPTSTIKRYLKANGERRHAKSCTHGPAPPALGRGKGVLPTVSTASVAARRGLGDVVHRPLSFPFNQLVLSTVTCNLPPPHSSHLRSRLSLTGERRPTSHSGAVIGRRPGGQSRSRGPAARVAAR